MSDATADVYDGAADILERDGWRQHAWGTVKGMPSCMGGAVAKTLGLHMSSGRQEEMVCDSYLSRVEKVLHERGDIILTTGVRYCGQVAVEWNDEEGRTIQEVLDVLRLTAKKERGL